MSTETDDPGQDASDYRAVFDNLPVSVVVYDLETGAVCATNEAAVDRFGRSTDQLCTTDLAALTAPSETLQSGIPWEATETDGPVEWQITTPEGPHWVEVQLRSAVVDGTERGVAVITDDAEPTETESQVRKQEQRLQTVVEKLPIVLFALDPDGTFTISRGRVLESLGIEPGEAVGNSIYDMYADSPDTIAAAERALNGETVRITEQIGEITFETWYRPVTDTAGEVQEVIGVAIDITEQHEREQLLEKKDAVLQQLTETTDDVFWLFNNDFSEIQFVNEAYEEVWGRSIDDLRADSMDFMNGVHPEDREIVTEAIEKLRAGKESDAEYRVNPKTEFQTWVWVRGKPIFDGNGEIERIAGFVREITDRKRREQQLDALNEATKQLSYEKTPDAVAKQVVDIAAEELGHPGTLLWQYDTDQNCLHPWVAAESTAGFDVDDSQSLSVDTAEMNAFQSTEPTVIEDYQLAGGTVRSEIPPESVLLIPVGDYGLLSVAAPTTAAFDVTNKHLLSILAGNAEAAFERAEREQALETYKNKLEESNENLQEFAYIASHDLQEPLRSVTSYADLLESEYGEILDDEGEFYVTRIVDNASQMSSMIDALLQYSRVKTQTSSFDEIDVDNVLDKTLSRLELLINESAAEITAGELPRVTADENQLGQVFQNLIKNAIEHGGETPIIEIAARDTGNAWEFAVSDNGPGIPAEQQERIFEIFQQATTDGDGAGIGLAVCERIVSRHRGDIWVESDDSGATFKFTTPKGTVD